MLADARERHYAELDAQAATIAHHLAEAGTAAEPLRCFRYLCRAGRFATASSAFEEALAHLERARRIEGVVPPAEWARLLADLANARLCTGAMDAAVEAYDAALDAFAALGDGEAIGEVCLSGGFTMVFLGRFAEAASMGRRGLAALDGQVSATRARLLGMVATPLAVTGGSHATAAATANEALEIAGQLGDDTLLADALAARAMIHFGRLEHRDAAEIGPRAIELFRSHGDAFGQVRPAGLLSDSLTYPGRFAGAEAYTSEHLAISERLGDPGSFLQLNRHRRLSAVLMAGDVDELAAFGVAEQAFTESKGMPWSSGWAWQGWARFLRGDWEGAVALYREAVRRDTSIGYSLGPFFEVLAYRGDREEALTLLDVVGLPRIGEVESWRLSALLQLAAAPEGLLVLGERDRAAALYPALLEMWERTGVPCPGYEDARLWER